MRNRRQQSAGSRDNALAWVGRWRSEAIRIMFVCHRHKHGNSYRCSCNALTLSCAPVVVPHINVHKFLAELRFNFVLLLKHLFGLQLSERPFSHGWAQARNYRHGWGTERGEVRGWERERERKTVPVARQISCTLYMLRKNDVAGPSIPHPTHTQPSSRFPMCHQHCVLSSLFYLLTANSNVFLRHVKQISAI